MSTPQPQVESILSEAGITGGAMPSTDPQEMASAILELFADRERCQSQGARLRELLTDKYTWGHNVEHIELECKQLTDVQATTVE